jgi:hypothetical protein
MSKSKIVDLELSGDGTYSPKNTKETKVSKAKSTKVVIKKSQYVQNKSLYMHNHADEFLVGLDAGLDFVEAMKSRAIRIMGLRD